MSAFAQSVLARLRPSTAGFRPGHVWIAGAGPGGLETMTLGVVAAMECADAIVHDALIDADMLTGVRAECFAMGKRGWHPSPKQPEINALLISLARDGRRVLRLKGGDPFVFGRGAEEVLALREADVPLRVLPGVTSALGASASALLPATARGVNRAVVLVTGNCATADDKPTPPDAVDWAALARLGQPIVVYMGLANLGRIAAALMAGGLGARTPAAVVMSATLPDERVLVSSLERVAADAADEGFSAPALVFIGENVALGAAMQPPAADSAAALPGPEARALRA
ncbi:uroporphyrinogen-III C-methyltransferase [Acuticoccus sp. MNP-M23]|uniref:uroporphyrinogen-III C-methyltransferase n=1 Tax=Acuticoccus sp. MNP-M23 TaxID=3072793 RepID=UPI002815BC86|nr:uroporphyrinogen-III C-methyltransferase [Acuticoccus sp. MNP-M23]WMS44312.1 uroporphyrinogen-III C-methyltransferase [Acuticoccus sp. MNP-M23]